MKLSDLNTAVVLQLSNMPATWPVEPPYLPVRGAHYFPITIGVGFSPVRLGLAGAPTPGHLPVCEKDGPDSLGWGLLWEIGLHPSQRSRRPPRLGVPVLGAADVLDEANKRDTMFERPRVANSPSRTKLSTIQMISALRAIPHGCFVR